ncbi:fibronectin type III domain-containing protein [Microbacterium sp. cf332]|uniref:fibronectin type III domain-containing protein n=1 Tax=Microbacterium sp. cf332 TaxID=1761804 RepID=UPI0008875570|nr:fibronectin type III domain-containing protein [Microbacterium sp. cf332]SDQ95374.1 hypothetical protein SAMN04487847_3024 [Microbacterium sp. cf332]
MKKKHPCAAAASVVLAAGLIVGGIAAPVHADETVETAETISVDTSAEVIDADEAETGGVVETGETGETDTTAIADETSSDGDGASAEYRASIADAAPLVPEPDQAQAADSGPADQTTRVAAPAFEASSFEVAPAPATVGESQDAPLDPDVEESRLRLVVTEIRADGASIHLSGIGNGSPVTRWTVIVTPVNGGSDIVKTATTETTFDFTGLEPGLYHLEGRLDHGDDGAFGSTGQYIVIPEAPSQPTVLDVQAGDSWILGGIRPGPLKNPLPETTGPTAALGVHYTVTLIGGGTERVVETDGWSSSLLSRFAFNDLEPETTYTIVVVAKNIAGSATSEPIEITTEATPGPVEPSEPAPPVAPLPDALTDDNRGGMNVPDTATAGTTITATIGADLQGMTARAWLFSTPTFLGDATIDENGQVSFPIPADVPAGTHRIVLTTDQNVLIAWRTLQIDAAAGGTDPVEPEPGQPEPTEPVEPGQPSQPTEPGTPGDGASVGAGNGTGHGAAVGSPAASGAPTRTDRHLASTGGAAPLALSLATLLLLVSGGALFARRKPVGERS